MRNSAEHSSLRQLAGEIANAMGGSSELGCIHSIQYVAADYPALEKYVWFTFSRELKKYKGCVEAFLTGGRVANVKLNESHQYTNTLVGLDWEEGPYWYRDFGNPPATGVTSELEEFQFEQDPPNRWERLEEGAVDTAPDVVNIWLKFLSRSFTYGAAMWISQSYQAHGAEDESSEERRASSIFLLFSKPISSDAVKYKISRVCRNRMIGDLLETLNGRVRHLLLQRDDEILRLINEGFAENFGVDSAPEDFKRIVSFLQLYQPIMIAGEIGTGKVRAARIIHDAVTKVLPRSDDDSKTVRPLPESKPGFLVLGLADYGNDRTIALKRLREEIEAVWPSGGSDGVNRPRGTLVIDDVHLAPVAVQRVLVDLLAFQADYHEPTARGGPTANQLFLLPNPIFVVTLNSAGDMPSDQIIEELWYRIAPFRIMIPSLRHYDMSEARSVVDKCLARVHRSLESRNPQKIVFSNETLDYLLAEHKFRGNFRELSTLILRAQVFYGLSADRSSRERMITPEEIRRILK